jgi:uncharacterized membrane protein
VLAGARHDPAGDPSEAFEPAKERGQAQHGVNCGFRVKNRQERNTLPARKFSSSRWEMTPMRINPQSTVRIAGHPLHPMLVPFPIACFVGVLLTDIVYWRTGEVVWVDFSTWLVTVGVVVGWLAAILGLIDFLGSRLIRETPPAWPHFIGNLLALIIATFNMLIHTRDAWTSVVPWGLVLSAVVVLILLVTGWLGWAMVYRHGVGVTEG